VQDNQILHHGWSPAELVTDVLPGTTILLWCIYYNMISIKTIRRVGQLGQGLRQVCEGARSCTCDEGAEVCMDAVPRYLLQHPIVVRDDDLVARL